MHSRTHSRSSIAGDARPRAGARLCVLAIALVPLAALASAVVGEGFIATTQATQIEAPAYVAYYWKARPGKEAEYNAYITGIAEKIDEDARRAGVLVEVVTVNPVPDPQGAVPDWTHLRIFTLKNLAAVDGLGPGLDAATRRVVPGEDQRKANSERAAGLRDFVRREVWTTLR